MKKTREREVERKGEEREREREREREGCQSRIGNCKLGNSIDMKRLRNSSKGTLFIFEWSSHCPLFLELGTIYQE